MAKVFHTKEGHDERMRCNNILKHLLREGFSVQVGALDDFMMGPRYLVIRWTWHVLVTVKLWYPSLRISFPTRKKYMRMLLEGKEMEVWADSFIDIGWDGPWRSEWDKPRRMPVLAKFWRWARRRDDKNE